MPPPRAFRTPTPARAFAPTAGVNAASLTLHHYPHPVLRAPGLPIEEVDAVVRAVAQRMFAIMHAHKGIGLAAPQAGLAWRLFVLDVPQDRAEEDGPTDGDLPVYSRGAMVFVNPELEVPRGNIEPYEEGCLSLPGIRGDVLRPATVRVKALDEHGAPFEMEAAGLLARCIQHEFDHINGVLILDKLTASARTKNRRAIRALEGE